MKNCHLITKAICSFLFIIFVISCQKEDTEPSPDLSIISDDDFDIISRHQNGWIKEAKKMGYRGATEADFEYYENGYIKYANIYKFTPEHYLFSSFERNEDNQPLSSKYYHPNGDLFLDIVYEDGQISLKTLYTESDTKTVFRYQNGRILTVEKSNGQNDQLTKVDYDYSAQKRTLTIRSGNQISHSEALPLSENLGAGFSTNEDLILSNLIPDQEPNENNIFSSQMLFIKSIFF